MDTYEVGSSSEQILLKVDVDTIGLAATRAILVDVNSFSPGSSVAQSVDATGDIPFKEIGIPTAVKNKRLSIFTKIDLTGSDKDARRKEYERLTGKYTLNMGTQGLKDFTDPGKTVNAGYITAFLNKHIDLI